MVAPHVLPVEPRGAPDVRVFKRVQPWVAGAHARAMVMGKLDFADIFYSNCISNGLLPITLMATEVDRLFNEVAEEPGYRLHMDLPGQSVTTPQGHAAHFATGPRRQTVSTFRHLAPKADEWPENSPILGPGTRVIDTLQVRQYLHFREKGVLRILAWPLAATKCQTKLLCQMQRSHGERIYTSGQFAPWHIRRRWRILVQLPLLRCHST